MSEKEQILDELHRIYEGDAWHAESLRQILTSISSNKAIAKPMRHIVYHSGQIAILKKPR